MKLIILTSSRFGTAAHHLPYLLESSKCQIAMVVLNEGVVPNKKSTYKKKLRKIFKIGILGALNGIRMRKWFNADMQAYKKIEDLETICKQHQIPFHTTDRINSESTRKLFAESGAELGISLGNSYIAEKIFSIPANGMINIHHEILPQYQNAQSIIWQIYNLSDNTGYTIHKIDRNIDTGEILFQERVPIVFGSTLRETVARTSIALLEASAKGLVKTIDSFEELNRLAKPQGAGTSYTTPSFWQYLRIERNFRKLRSKQN